MRLLIDAGNTRLKWRLCSPEATAVEGACLFEDSDWLNELAPLASDIERVAVSTVVSEEKRQLLVDQLRQISSAAVNFYWSEASRQGLRNAYSNFGTMGADRWHAMYAGWCQSHEGFAVVDAGSAITVDYVKSDGSHLGGYILPGKQMMFRSLRQDAARIGFDPLAVAAGAPGVSTTECVQHGLVWLWESLVHRVAEDCQRHGLGRILCTGGDASGLLAAGLPAQHHPDLVLAGLAAIDSEDGSSS